MSSLSALPACMHIYIEPYTYTYMYMYMYMYMYIYICTCICTCGCAVGSAGVPQNAFMALAEGPPKEIAGGSFSFGSKIEEISEDLGLQRLAFVGSLEMTQLSVFGERWPFQRYWLGHLVGRAIFGNSGCQGLDGLCCCIGQRMAGKTPKQ